MSSPSLHRQPARGCAGWNSYADGSIPDRRSSSQVSLRWNTKPRRRCGTRWRRSEEPRVIVDRLRMQILRSLIPQSTLRVARLRSCSIEIGLDWRVIAEPRLRLKDPIQEFARSGKQPVRGEDVVVPPVVHGIAMPLDDAVAFLAIPMQKSEDIREVKLSQSQQDVPLGHVPAYIAILPRANAPILPPLDSPCLYGAI